MKASDADRDVVLAGLSEHFQAGRLTSAELEERTGRALAARTLGELDDLVADLPSPQTAGPASAGGPSGDTSVAGLSAHLRSPDLWERAVLRGDCRSSSERGPELRQS
jgi:hypothetical protein